MEVTELLELRSHDLALTDLLLRRLPHLIRLVPPQPRRGDLLNRQQFDPVHIPEPSSAALLWVVRRRTGRREQVDGPLFEVKVGELVEARCGDEQGRRKDGLWA